ncbi:hypothetical protein [Kocuria sabuli]|uniref:hypothetical protein n=1 Tax=Kocuria sabuli TaxID=3071448 RepID=UPI0034D6279D
MISSCPEWIQEILEEVNTATIVDETATLYIFLDLEREAGGVIPLTVGPTG